MRRSFDPLRLLRMTHLGDFAYIQQTDKLGFDIYTIIIYNVCKRIRQFATILSIIKTRERGAGAMRPFLLPENAMKRKTRFLTQSAIIAALYAVLTWMQNLLIPNSASWAIQFRASEALCILAYFTPAAIPGLSIGCLLFNLTFAHALPLDFLVGTAASCLAAVAMYSMRKHPFIGFSMPAIFNAILVGWELDLYIGGGFWLCAAQVAIGELAVLYTLGCALYYAIRGRKLDIWLKLE